jgi:trimeric autotransporter adhesin
MAVNNLNTGVGIQPTIVDAKGDLIAATANDAVNRLAVGTNGQVLVADSGETTGLKWNNPGTVGGLVHINTTSFSAVASQSINDVFSATYDNYF